MKFEVDVLIYYIIAATHLISVISAYIHTSEQNNLGYQNVIIGM